MVVIINEWLYIKIELFWGQLLFQILNWMKISLIWVLKLTVYSNNRNRYNNDMKLLLKPTIKPHWMSMKTIVYLSIEPLRDINEK
jgi:hypothetical protein